MKYFALRRVSANGQGIKEKCGVGCVYNRYYCDGEKFKNKGRAISRTTA